MAYIAGSLFAVYLISRLAEWAILKRILSNRTSIIAIGMALSTSLTIAGRLNQSEQIGRSSGEDSVFIIVLICGALAIGLLRIVISKRRTSKDAA